LCLSKVAAVEDGTADSDISEAEGGAADGNVAGAESGAARAGAMRKFPPSPNRRHFPLQARRAQREKK
jgi:hypothetical protein